MTTYSNPRREAVIDNWPMGSQRRGQARFYIESSKRGERAVRVTDGAPKKLTFARKARIVDGDDGKTYIAELSMYGHVSIMQGNMKFQETTVFPTEARYPELLALFAED